MWYKCSTRTLREDMQEGGEGIPRLERVELWKRREVHDQSLYFEITYFSISLINDASLAFRRRQGA